MTNTEFSKNDSGWRKNFNSSSIAIFILHKNIQEFDIKLLYDLKNKVHRVIVIAIGVAEGYLENLKVRKIKQATSVSLNPHTPVAQKNADEVVFRRFHLLENTN